METEVKYNLPKHIAKAYLGKNLNTHTISSKHFRRICLIIAWSIQEHGNNQEYLQQLLIAIFEEIKKHSNRRIIEQTGPIMCEIHKYVKLYLESDFHPENILSTD